MYTVNKVTLWRFISTTWQLHLIIIAVSATASVTYLSFINQYFRASGIVVTVLAAAISFFIGFINSQAYDRWWEARKIWGALVNDSRSFCRMVTTFFSTESIKTGTADELRSLQKQLVCRHLAFLYAIIDQLRGQNNSDYHKYLSNADLEEIKRQSHIPNAILALQAKSIDSEQRKKNLELFRMIEINHMLIRFTESLGKSERIKHTPFPVYYTSLIRIAIWIFLIIFPMSLSDAIGYWAIPSAYLGSMILTLVFQAGQMMLNPFEGKPMDTPISAITRTIEINMLEQLGEEDIPARLEPVDGLYLL